MGLARFHAGDRAAASALFEVARGFLDGAASTWHLPIFHQYAALAIASLPAPQREALATEARASRDALAALAVDGAVNFAHRLALVEGRLDDAIAGARAGGWHNDLGLAHELKGDHAAAREAYAAWGATAVAARLGDTFRP
jgi:hypothetical protein